MKNKIEKIQRVFLKGNLWKGNKMQLVNWHKICKEKKFGYFTSLNGPIREQLDDDKIIKDWHSLFLFNNVRIVP